MVMQPPPVNPSVISKAARQGAQTRDVPMVGWLRWMPVGLYGAAGAGGYRDINPDNIGFDILDEMRRYPTIKAALTLCKMPILGRIRTAAVQCDDPAIKAFVEAKFLENGLLYRLVRTSLRSLDFGCAPHEVVWQSEDVSLTYTETDPDTGEEQEYQAWDGPALTFKAIKEVNPQTIREIRHRTQPKDGQPADWSYDGFIQNPDIAVEAINSYWYTHDTEYGNLWGRARTRDAYAQFFWVQAVWKWWLNWTEKKAAPPRVARYPEGTAGDGITPNSTIAVATANAIDSMTAVAMPNNTDAAGKYLWDLTELPTSDRVAVFQTTQQAIDQQMLYAMFVPEKVFTNPGDTGTYSQTSEHADIFLMTLDAELLDQVDAVNTDLLPRLVEVNFGAAAWAKTPARITVSGLTDEERDLLKEVFLALLAQPNEAASIDFDKLAERFNVPVRQEEEQPGPEPDQDTAPVPVLASPEEQQPELPAAPDIAAASPGSSSATAGAPGSISGQPSNLVLAGDDSPARVVSVALLDVARAEAADRFQVSADPSSILGYKVIDTATGKRLSGFAAMQVIKSYLKGQASAAKKAASKKTPKPKAAPKPKTPAKPKAPAKPKKAAAGGAGAKPKAVKAPKVPVFKPPKTAAPRAAATKSAAPTASPAAKAHVKAAATRVSAKTASLPAKAAATVAKAAGLTVTGSPSTPAQAVQQAQALAAQNPHLLVTTLPTVEGVVVATMPAAAAEQAAAAQGIAARSGGPAVAAEDAPELNTEYEPDAGDLYDSESYDPGDDDAEPDIDEDEDSGSGQEEGDTDGEESDDAGYDADADDAGEGGARGHPRDGALADRRSALTVPSAAERPGRASAHGGSPQLSPAAEQRGAATAVALALVERAAQEITAAFSLPAEDGA